ncbi:MAG: cytochrome b [Marivirga sp.]|nr:cytochrome b [Marivirga sp.]
MYTGLFHTHSLLRYFILIALVVVIVKAVLGLINKQPYGKWDNKLGLYLFIFTHMQLLIGLILYFVSPFVKFGSETMSDKTTRYWTVEHIMAMLIAVVLITLARTTSKRMTDDAAKHKRMLIFNSLALIIIIATIMMSGRRLL